MNLYEFSQVNNNEMGILVRRQDDAELYRDAYEEAQRIIRISDEVRISMERVTVPEEPVDAEQDGGQEDAGDAGKLTSSRLARKLGIKTAELLDRLVAKGHLEVRDDKQYLTEAGRSVGGEFRMSQRFGPYFLWPDSLEV